MQSARNLSNKNGYGKLFLTLRQKFAVLTRVNACVRVRNNFSGSNKQGSDILELFHKGKVFN
jgi:hypothetical protein